MSHRDPRLTITNRHIIMKLAEAIALFETTGAEVKKVQAEIVGKLTELQASVDTLTAQLADVTLTDEQAASVQAVVDGVAALDAIVPDAEVVA